MLPLTHEGLPVMNHQYTIGQLARAAGVPTTTLRYYERAGLVRPTTRAENQYRLYTEQTLQIIRFIRAAQAAGFTLDDVRTLLGEQLLTLAQQVQDPGILIAAHRAGGMTLFWMGAVASAQTHFAQGIALYDPPHNRASTFLYGEAAGVICHIYAAWTLWMLGYPEQGLARSQEAMMLAQQSAHPYSRSFALCCAAIFHQFRREVCFTQERAEAVINLAKEQGFPQWRAQGSIVRGWALAQQGQAKEGIEQLQQSMQAFRATGAEINQPYFLALLAEAHGTIGEPEAELTVLTEALTHIDTKGERWYESECYRLKGELLLQQGSDNQAEAVSCFAQAIAVAQSQQAKFWELRATTSLARLWQWQGKQAEAHALLAPVYGWFTEGFDTADLIEAKALLGELA
jgi:DNA-binding transcriptional MerR regulator